MHLVKPRGGALLIPLDPAQRLSAWGCSNIAGLFHGTVSLHQRLAIARSYRWKEFECSFFFWSLIYRVSGRGPKYTIGARDVYRGTSCYELALKDHAQPRSGPHPASILNAKAMAQKPPPWGSQRTPGSHGQGTSSPRTLDKMIPSDDDVTQIAVSLYTGVIRTDDQAAGKYGAGGVTVG
jgi:hypothetical protein